MAAAKGMGCNAVVETLWCAFRARVEYVNCSIEDLR